MKSCLELPKNTSSDRAAIQKLWGNSSKTKKMIPSKLVNDMDYTDKSILKFNQNTIK